MVERMYARCSEENGLDIVTLLRNSTGYRELGG
jgi:hypothetical protein